MKAQEYGYCEEGDIALVKYHENDGIKYKWISIFGFIEPQGRFPKVVDVLKNVYLSLYIECFYSMPGDALYLDPEFIEKLIRARIN